MRARRSPSPLAASLSIPFVFVLEDVLFLRDWRSYLPAPPRPIVTLPFHPDLGKSARRAHRPPRPSPLPLLPPPRTPAISCPPTLPSLSDHQNRLFQNSCPEFSDWPADPNTCPLSLFPSPARISPINPPSPRDARLPSFPTTPSSSIAPPPPSRHLFVSPSITMSCVMRSFHHAPWPFFL